MDLASSELIQQEPVLVKILISAYSAEQTYRVTKKTEPGCRTYPRDSRHELVQEAFFHQVVHQKECTFDTPHTLGKAPRSHQESHETSRQN